MILIFLADLDGECRKISDGSKISQLIKLWNNLKNLINWKVNTVKTGADSDPHLGGGGGWGAHKIL